MIHDLPTIPKNEETDGAGWYQYRFDFGGAIWRAGYSCRLQGIEHAMTGSACFFVKLYDDPAAGDYVMPVLRAP